MKKLYANTEACFTEFKDLSDCALIVRVYEQNVPGMMVCKKICRL